MQPEKRKLLIVVTSNANSDKSTIAFTVANTALSSGMEVAVFLASDGVDLCRDGAGEMTQVKPFKPLGELVDQFTSAGGVLLACGSCFQHRGLKQDQNHHHVQISGVATLVQWLAEASNTITF